MAALDVLPLDEAKDFLNISRARSEWDGELSGFIAAAVERVERHIAGEAGIGVTLVAAADANALQLLAVKAVLAEYWRTQRTRGVGRGGAGGTTAAAVEADSGPAGMASLRARLVDLLGPAAEPDGLGTVPAPRGTFPPAQAWPDPVPPYASWPVR